MLKKEIQVIKTTGEIDVLPGVPTLAQMQLIVGGYIELVNILDVDQGDGRVRYTRMIVNEDGLNIGLPRNEKATEHYQRNSRVAFPDAENPFRAAHEAMVKQYPGMTVIDAGIPGYNDDPYVTGDVIFFSGYTREELQEIL